MDNSNNVPDSIKNAVKNNDRSMIRIMLCDPLLLDPTSKTFNVYLKYVLKNIPDFYDRNEPDNSLSKDPKEWTKDYMNHLMVLTKMKFTQERVNLLKKVVRVVLSDKIIKIERT